MNALLFAQVMAIAVEVFSPLAQATAGFATF
jgi:hypothetical protein